MPQVPVLFLPKGTHGKKTTVKKTPVKIQQKQKNVKLAALLRGINGHQENTKKSRRS